MKVYTHSRYSYVRVAEISRKELRKIEFDLCKEPRETLGSYYSRRKDKPDILINAGFFNMSNGATVFNYISGGKVIHSDTQYKWGLGVVGDTDVSYGEISTRDWTGWISGYPVLLDSGEKVVINFASEINYKARRTMIGYNDSTIYIVCVENPGMNFKQMQNLMLELGCKFAINLDGGGSSKMLHNGISVTKDVGNRAVDNVIAVYLKEEPKKMLYKVQLGAFAIKKNAENYLKTIKNIDKQYEGAYITKVGLLYKIQVGAFSVKANAEKMMDDLKKRGYPAFVVKVEQ